MLFVLVDIWVKQAEKSAFITATRSNVEQSRLESGIVAFDLHVDPQDDGHFLLVEVYLDASAPLAHKETAHYRTWRDTVEPMMAQPRRSTQWQPLDTRY